MKNALMVVVLAASLSGCVSAKEEAAQNARQDDQKCRSYGAQPGSDAYVKCRTDLSGQRAAEEQASYARGTAAAAAAGASAAQASRQVICTRIGTMTTCN